MDNSGSGSFDLDAQTATTGVVIKSTPQVGCTLGVATYYFALGSERAPIPAETATISAQLILASGVAATITLESTNCAATVNQYGQGAPDVTDFEVSNRWTPLNLTPTGGTFVGFGGTGASASGMTGTATGGGACSFLYNLEAFGGRRVRVKVVTTVGGVVRVSRHGKVGD